MPFHEDCESLVKAGTDIFDREVLMAAPAYEAWLAMQEAASEDDTLQIVSAFRSASTKQTWCARSLSAGTPSRIY